MPIMCIVYTSYLAANGVMLCLRRGFLYELNIFMKQVRFSVYRAYYCREALSTAVLRCLAAQRHRSVLRSSRKKAHSLLTMPKILSNIFLFSFIFSFFIFTLKTLCLLFLCFADIFLHYFDVVKY